MKIRLSAFGITLIAGLAACHSNPAGVAKTDASQNAQLERINARTTPGSGRRMLFATPEKGGNGDLPSTDSPTLGQQMQASRRPPQ